MTTEFYKTVVEPSFLKLTDFSLVNCPVCDRILTRELDRDIITVWNCGCDNLKAFVNTNDPCRCTKETKNVLRIICEGCVLVRCDVCGNKNVRYDSESDICSSCSLIKHEQKLKEMAIRSERLKKQKEENERKKKELEAERQREEMEKERKRKEMDEKRKKRNLQARIYREKRAKKRKEEHDKMIEEARKRNEEKRNLKITDYEKWWEIATEEERKDADFSRWWKTASIRSKLKSCALTKLRMLAEMKGVENDVFCTWAELVDMLEPIIKNDDFYKLKREMIK